MTKNILALTIAAIAFTATASSAFASAPTVDVSLSNVSEFVFSVPAEAAGEQVTTETSAILHTVKGSRGYRGHRGHRSHRNYGYHSYRGHSRYGYGYNRNQNRNGYNNHGYQRNSIYQTKSRSSLGVVIFKDIY